VEPVGAPFAIAAGQALLTAVGGGVEPLPEAADLVWTGEQATTLDERMDMWLEDGVWQMSSWFGIDGESWHPDHTGAPDVAYAPTARFASVGQVARWEIRSQSAMAHPFHLHGFSFQPIAVTRWPDPEEPDAAQVPARYGWGRTEFADTVIVPGNSSVELLVRFDDPSGAGGAIGRWMEHCHILQHGELGMMSELVIQ
jgi:FtsP/CotA-like multicopper oxidase with cupredoxin domain